MVLIARQHTNTTITLAAKPGNDELFGAASPKQDGSRSTPRRAVSCDSGVGDHHHKERHSRKSRMKSPARPKCLHRDRTTSGSLSLLTKEDESIPSLSATTSSCHGTGLFHNSFLHSSSFQNGSLHASVTLALQRNGTDTSLFVDDLLEDSFALNDDGDTSLQVLNVSKITTMASSSSNDETSAATSTGASSSLEEVTRFCRDRMETYQSNIGVLKDILVVDGIGGLLWGVGTTNTTSGGEKPPTGMGQAGNGPEEAPGPCCSGKGIGSRFVGCHHKGNRLPTVTPDPLREGALAA